MRRPPLAPMALFLTIILLHPLSDRLGAVLDPWEGQC